MYIEKIFAYIGMIFCTFLRITDKIREKIIKPKPDGLIPDSTPIEQFYKRQLPSICTSLNNQQGQDIFFEAHSSGYLKCYFKLASQFRTQEQPASCGLSSIIIILNTLEIDPGRIWKGIWRWYDEGMLLNCPSVKNRIGINFDSFIEISRNNQLKAVPVRVDDSCDINKFRETVKECTQSEDCFLVLNYSRPALGQTGEGHFSPIGGYHPDKDLVLVMDTARYKYPPYWVSLKLLFHSMHLIDSDTGKSRGYIVLSRKYKSVVITENQLTECQCLDNI